MGLCYELGDRKQLGHGFKWFTGVILIKPSYNDAATVASHPVNGIDEFHVKKLSFVDAHHLRVVFDVLHHLGSGCHRPRKMFKPRVRSDLLSGVTNIYCGLKDLDLLACDSS